MWINRAFAATALLALAACSDNPTGGGSAGNVQLRFGVAGGQASGALFQTGGTDALTVQPRSFTGLDLGRHELHIAVLGNSRPRSEGTKVAIDTFTVLP